jgi:hydroxymethylbilane synthase
MTPLRIGTRGSPLALWQARHIADRLRAVVPGFTVELVEIQTAGDTSQVAPLVQLGGEGLFTKAIQDALLAGGADIAVHSLKDLPTFAVAGLLLAAVPPRGPTGDAFVSRKYRSFAALPPGAVVASSSLRRKAQLLYRRPDLKIVNIRGNVETRLRKLTDENLDATILAEAGLVRLGLAEQITEILDPAWMLPAVGQGALGLECRADDIETRAVLARLDDPATHAAVLAERALLRGLGGGCQVPIGAAAIVTGTQLRLRAVVLAPDGSGRVEAEVTGPMAQGGALGEALAEELRQRGANELLAN